MELCARMLQGRLLLSILTDNTKIQVCCHLKPEEEYLYMTKGYKRTDEDREILNSFTKD